MIPQDWFEHSHFFRGCGKLGFGLAESARTPIMCSAFIASLVSWIMMIFSALALADSMEPIQKFGWAKATFDAPGVKLDLDLGIKALAVTAYNKTSMVMRERVTAWDDDACGNAASTEMEAACNECKDQLDSSVSFILLSIITQFVQLTTDLQRGTQFGDVNCQKTFGIATGIFGCVSGVSSMVSFANSCWSGLPTRLTINGVKVEAEWKRGSGWMLMLLATGLKCYDAVCHLIVPTPPGRHEPYRGALLNYMKRGVPGCKGQRVDGQVMTATGSNATEV